MIKLMGMVDYGSPFGKKPVKEAKIPNFFLQMEKVKKNIDTLVAQRKTAVAPYNKETDPKRKEQLKQVLIKLTNQIKSLEQEMISLRNQEIKYIEDLDANTQLDVSVAESKMKVITKQAFKKQ